MEHDHRALLGRQTSKAALQLVPIGDRERRIRDRGAVDAEELDRRRQAPFRASLVVAGMEDQAVRPGLPTTWVSERRDVAPRLEEGVLGRVPRKLRLAEDAVRDRVQAIDRR